MKGGVTVFIKSRLLSLFVTLAPLALAVCRLCIGTKTGGMNDGGFTMQ
jgi:hypothetical protein